MIFMARVTALHTIQGLKYGGKLAHIGTGIERQRLNAQHGNKRRPGRLTHHHLPGCQIEIPDRILSSIPAAVRRMAMGGNAMENPVIVDRYLTDLLIEQARTRPDDIAVRHAGDSLTYRELVSDSVDLAHYLRYLGTARDSRVAVLVDSSLDLAVGTWGVLFAGSAYLPLSPDYPDERLRYMLEDAGVTVAFCQESLRSRLESLAPPRTVITTPEDAAEYRKANSEETQKIPLENPDPQSLAYVIYTSGSTGRPKGVMIEHRSIAHQMNWLRQAYHLDSSRVVLQKTPMSFDAAQWEILASSCGSTVIFGAPGIHRDPNLLIETVVREQITTVQCVPTLLRALVDTDELHRCVSLTHIFSGGEALSRNLARQCTEILPDCTVVNVYGPTECTINTAAHTVDPAALGDGPRSVPIGTPVDGLRHYVLDAHLRPLKPGETGELYISGIQLARGYLHRPDLTADRFVTGPFGAPAPHDRLYRTGDLAYWNPDGTMQFAGRADNQVKLRGFRIELDEIRLAIEAHDWVKNAAVLVRDDPHTGFQNLIACIELSPREAALMDQGNHDTHHLSKESKLQVRAQLSSPGVRDVTESAGAAAGLPGATATPQQRRRAFARKTYRFYDGERVGSPDLLAALGRRVEGPHRARPTRSRSPNSANSCATSASSGARSGSCRNTPTHHPDRSTPRSSTWRSWGSTAFARGPTTTTRSTTSCIRSRRPGPGHRPGSACTSSAVDGRSSPSTGTTSAKSWRSKPATWSGCSTNSCRPTASPSSPPPTIPVTGSG